MENIIIFIIVAVIAVVNIVRNFQKEKKKNQGRVVVQVPPLNQPAPASRPFSRKADIQYNNVPEIKPQSDQPAESAVQMQMNKYISINDLYSQQEMNAFSQEGTSSSSERAAFGNETSSNSDSDSNSIDLQLNTLDDYKRAFLHTLIFDRKY